MITFAEFLQSSQRNSYVKERGFRALYVRQGPRIINKVRYDYVIDIANAQVYNPGCGVFGRFVERLKKRRHPIFFECVVNPRLARWFERHGYHKIENLYPSIGYDSPPHFYWLPPKNKI